MASPPAGGVGVLPPGVRIGAAHGPLDARAGTRLPTLPWRSLEPLPTLP